MTLTDTTGSAFSHAIIGAMEQHDPMHMNLLSEIYNSIYTQDHPNYTNEEYNYYILRQLRIMRALLEMPQQQQRHVILRMEDLLTLFI